MNYFMRPLGITSFTSPWFSTPHLSEGNVGVSLMFSDINPENSDTWSYAVE